MEAQSPLTPKLHLQRLNLFNETLFRVRIRGLAKVAHLRPRAHNQFLFYVAGVLEPIQTASPCVLWRTCGDVWTCTFPSASAECAS